VTDPASATRYDVTRCLLSTTVLSALQLATPVQSSEIAEFVTGIPTFAFNATHQQAAALYLDPKSPGMPTPKNALSCTECATRAACLLNMLSDDEVRALQPQIEKRRFHHGERISTEGEVSRSVRVLKIGNVFGYRRGLDGQERPIGIAGRGASFGLSGYFDQPNQVSGIAATALRVCDISHETLHRLAATKPAFGEHMTSIAVNTCGLIAAWSEGMRVRGLVNQLAYVLVLLSQAHRSSIIDLPTHTALAELLGTTRETVARAFSTLRAEGGLMLLERRKCDIDREALLGRFGRRAAPAPIETTGATGATED
jgi:CRP/FNR family transcriptional regulator, cyclic AMP receptor protein